MPRSAETVRLRALPSHLTSAAFETLPLAERQKCRPLFWRPVGEFEPLTFWFWGGTSLMTQAAFLRAMHHIQEDVGHTLFQQAPHQSGSVNLMLGEYEAEEVEDWSMFSMPILGFLRGGGESDSAFGPIEEQEFGYCQHWWDKSGCVLGATAAVDLGLAWADRWHIAAHELGHALLLGHDPDTPMRMMYRKHTGVGRLKPIERKWVCDIHGLPYIPKRKRGRP